MDSIIGLLIVLVPVAFALVGKLLESAGKDGRNQDPSMPEVFPELKTVLPKEEEGERVVPQRKPEKKVAPSKAAPYKVAEEEKPRKKEPVDPKKLVIYSEIMKPKYLD